MGKYNFIAFGSLVQKLLDIVILLLKSEKLRYDVIQFGFEATASTTMCTWIVTLVIDYLPGQWSVFGPHQGVRHGRVEGAV